MACSFEAKKLCRKIHLVVLVSVQICLCALCAVPLSIFTVSMAVHTFDYCGLPLPIFVFVDATAFVIFTFATILVLVNAFKEEKSQLWKDRSLYVVLSLVILSWLICGTIWITNVSQTIYLENPCPSSFVALCFECRDLVDATFYTVISHWIAFGLVFPLCVSFICLYDASKYIKENSFSPEQHGVEEKS